jgi:hypothetical protein
LARGDIRIRSDERKKNTHLNESNLNQLVYYLGEACGFYGYLNFENENYLAASFA